MRTTLVTLVFLLSGVSLGLAGEPALVLDVWPAKPPGEVGNTGEEKFWDKRPDGKPIPDVAGKPVKWLTKVSKPTITVYRPAKDKDTGTAMLICPGGGTAYSRAKGTYELTPDVPLHKGCPPMFLVATSDDGDKPEIATCMYLAMKQAGIPAELHVYASGGHNFGLRPSAEPCSTWPQRCTDWLQSQGWLTPGPGR